MRSSRRNGAISRSRLIEPQPSDLVVFEHDKEVVLEAFRRGEFDAVEVVNEVAERNFFHFLGSQKLLGVGNK